MQSIELTINGEQYQRAVRPTQLLADFLRDELMLTGTKVACGTGDCGACSVLLDGHVVPSCLVLAAEADQGCLTTVEYFSRDGQPSFVQEELVQAGAVQCGFCTPGIVVSAHALLAANPQPSGDEVRTALAGNLCRCTGYAKIVQAVLTAAARSER